VSHGVLDLPNARSSHNAPTPRGGGIAIVVTFIVTSCAFALFGLIASDLFWALTGGGLGVAIVGYLDDRKPLPARVRLAIHLTGAAWAVYELGGLPPIQWGSAAVHLGLWGDVLAVFAIAWILNFFNFMDGIDGIAGSEAVFVAAFGAGLCWMAGVDSAVSYASLTLAAASLGFLLWNWPPAKIFMGDVGSGYLGYILGVLALAAGRQSPAILWAWLILGGVFFVDATVTLVRRLLRGDRVYEAHRSHGYQWLARRLRSHKSVTMTVTAINLLWLLPCASFAALHPRWAMWTALAALIPLGIAAFVAGSGRRESI
jgi:Fuc2NAc and GlcNAc transferase